MHDSTLILSDEQAMADLAVHLASRAMAGDVILLSGPLGAGKSTFARAFIRARSGHPLLDVPSPSFTLVQTYDAAGTPIWHFDLWRLTGPEALEELAWEDAQSGIVLVEWPERLGALTPERALGLSIAFDTRGRVITLTGEDRWFDES